MAHIHSNDQFDFTVSAVIIHDNKALMLFHHKLQLWLSPAGHIELDETPIDALYREIEEETGLKKGNLTLVTPHDDNQTFDRDSVNRGEPLPFDIESHPIGPDGHRHIDLAYILLSDTADIRVEPDAAEALTWVTLEELGQLSPMPKVMYSRASYALKKVQELQ